MMEKTVAVIDVATISGQNLLIIKTMIMTIKRLNVPKHKKLYHLSKANTNFSFSISQKSDKNPITYIYNYNSTLNIGYATMLPNAMGTTLASLYITSLSIILIQNIYLLSYLFAFQWGLC